VASFVLSLPPSTNHAYLPRSGGGRYKSDLLRAWEDEAALVLRGWEPPTHTPLAVHVLLVVPRNKLRTADIDGYLKAALDAIVGKRRDAWVDELLVDKRPVEGLEEPHMVVWVMVLGQERMGRVSDAADEDTLDRLHMEPGHRLYQDQRGLRELLRAGDSA
jgi:Holliday junction resolvase RusA-like endonuclease